MRKSPALSAKKLVPLSAFLVGIAAGCGAEPADDELAGEVFLAAPAPALEVSDPVDLNPADPPIDLQCCPSNDGGNLDFSNYTTFLDFGHWGKDSATSFNRARGVRPYVPNFTKLGGGTVTRFTTNTPKFKWQFGSSSKIVASTAAGVSLPGPTGSGFQVNLPAEAEHVQCTLYAQAQNAEGQLRLAMSGVSTQTRFIANKAFAIDFKFRGNAGTNLNMSWTFQRGTGRVVLYAVHCRLDPPQLPPLLTLERVNPRPPYYSPASSVKLNAHYLGEWATMRFTKVEFYADGGSTPIGTATNPNLEFCLPKCDFSIQVALAPGWHVFQAVGTRTADGRRLRSAPLYIPVWAGTPLTIPGMAVPDNNPTGVTINLPISGVPTGLRVIDTFARVGAQHTWVGDLVVRALAPDGTSVALARNNGGSGDDFQDTGFHDLAETAISAGAPPFPGEYRPVEPLSRFNGKTVNGTWKLNVADIAASDVGSLNLAEVRVLAD